MNPKAPYAVGYAIERALGRPVAVMGCPLTWRWSDGGIVLAVPKQTDIPLRALIDRTVLDMKGKNK